MSTEIMLAHSELASKLPKQEYIDQSKLHKTAQPRGLTVGVIASRYHGSYIGCQK